MITHDDRYFGCADRLIKLDYGRLTGGRRRDTAGATAAVSVEAAAFALGFSPHATCQEAAPHLK